MKPQSIHSALQTHQVLRDLQEPFDADEAKLGWRHCVTTALQLTLSLVGCVVLHWAMV